MPKNVNRTGRVAEAVHRLLARCIREEFKDPRVGMITITSVDVSPDLKYAKVYVTVLEDEKRAETIEILNQANGFFRSQLAKALPSARVIPKPHFIFDDSILKGNRIQSILEIFIDKP